jgi:hypothetical protein
MWSGLWGPRGTLRKFKWGRSDVIMGRRYFGIFVLAPVVLTALVLVAAASKSKATEWSTDDAQRTATVSTEAGPAYESDGRLKFPAHYREWIYLSSGVDMAYAKGAPLHSAFDNVFVEPTAYREYQRTGAWPDGTLLVLELRAAAEKGSINQHGKFQSGTPLGVQVHVKDARRYKGNWAFFAFDNAQPAALIPMSEDCYDCHQAHGAVDTTFVQFYPTLLPVATLKRTLKPGVDVLIVVPGGPGRSRTRTQGSARTTGSATTGDATSGSGASGSATNSAAQPRE